MQSRRARGACACLWRDDVCRHRSRHGRGPRRGAGPHRRSASATGAGSRGDGRLGVARRPRAGLLDRHHARAAAGVSRRAAPTACGPRPGHRRCPGGGGCRGGSRAVAGPGGRPGRCCRGPPGRGAGAGGRRTRVVRSGRLRPSARRGTTRLRGPPGPASRGRVRHHPRGRRSGLAGASWRDSPRRLYRALGARRSRCARGLSFRSR